MGKKKAIKGFSALRYWPLVKNTSTEYSVGDMNAIVGAQSATIDRQGEDYSIPADDGMYDEGTEFTRDQLEVTVTELGLDLMAALDGADYDETTKEYTWGPGAVVPEIALGFRAAMLGGGWRLVRYFKAKVTKIKADFNTKGGGGAISSYVLSISATTRAVDDKLVQYKDVDTAEDLAWLNTIPAVPAEG